MSDLIDRESAYKVLTEYYHHSTEKQHRALREALKRVPSAEPKKGKWIDMGDFEQCSVCMTTHLKTIHTKYGAVIWMKSDYCPYCGARMADK